MTIERRRRLRYTLPGAWVAVVFAFGSALVNAAFLAAYPVWSAMMIAVDILVIWAVTVHGSEIRNRDTGQGTNA